MDRKTKKLLEQAEKARQEARGFGQIFKETVIEVIDDGKIVSKYMKQPTLYSTSVSRKIFRDVFNIDISNDVFRETLKVQETLKEEDEHVRLGATMTMINDLYIIRILENVFYDSVEVKNGKPKIDNDSKYVLGLESILNMFIDWDKEIKLDVEDDMITESNIANLLAMVILYLITPS